LLLYPFRILIARLTDAVGQAAVFYMFNRIAKRYNYCSILTDSFKGINSFEVIEHAVLMKMSQPNVTINILPFLSKINNSAIDRLLQKLIAT